MFRPLSVDNSDMPPDLAKVYPNDQMILVDFKPVTHPASKDGSNLQEGEGSWLDRGMRPSEPGRIRFLVADGDMLLHTLKVSEGPFILNVRNSRKGYFETVPIVSPELQLVSKPSPTPSISAAPTTPALSLSGEVVVAMRYLQLKGVSHPRLYLYRADGRLLRKLTKEVGPVDDINPFFSPDGSVIVFTRLTVTNKAYWSIEPFGKNLHQLTAAPDWYQTIVSRSGLVDSDSLTTPPPPETSDLISKNTDNNSSEEHYRLPNNGGEFISKEISDNTGVHYTDTVIDSKGQSHTVYEGNEFLASFDPNGNTTFASKGDHTFAILVEHDSTENGDFVLDLSDSSVRPLTSSRPSLPLPGLDGSIDNAHDVNGIDLYSIPEGFLAITFSRYEPYGTKEEHHTDAASDIEIFNDQLQSTISYALPGAGQQYGASWYRGDVTPHVYWLPTSLPATTGLAVPDPKEMDQ